MLARTKDHTEITLADTRTGEAARLFVETRTRTASPFEMTSYKVRRASDMTRALTTGVLVLYPVFASAAVVVVSLLLGNQTV